MFVKPWLLAASGPADSKTTSTVVAWIRGCKISHFLVMEGILTLSNMCALQHIEISQVHVHKAKNSLLLSRELGAVVMVRTLSVSAADDIFLLGEDMIFSSGSFHQWKRLLTSAFSWLPSLLPRNCCSWRCAGVSTSSTCLKTRWDNPKIFT